MKKISLLIVIFSLFLFSTPSAFADGPWAHIGLDGHYVGSVAVDPTNASILYAGVDDGVYKSTDGGANWTRVLDGGDNSFFISIAPSNHNILYASVGAKNIRKSVDGGNTWTNLNNDFGADGSIMDIVIDPLDANTAYISMYHNCIWKTTDGGINWDSHCFTETYRLILDPSNHNTLYAGTSGGGQLFKSTDAAITWTNTGNSGLGSVGAIRGIAIDYNNTNTIYAGVETTGIYKSIDRGANWSFLSDSPSTGIGSALITHPTRINTLYARSSFGVSQSIDGGNTWTDINSGQTPSGIARLIVYENTLYAVTTNGVYSYPLDTAEGTTRIIASPSSGTKTVGVPFTVDIKVEDAGEAFNAVRANVAVSSNLSITGLSEAVSNPCDLFYVQNPSTENPSFAGAIFGGSSNGCTVYTITLTPTSAGTGTIAFTNGSIKAYSDNSEILTGVQNASFTIENSTVNLGQLTVTSPILTYLQNFHLFGTKDPLVSHVFMNDSEANSTYPTSTSWDTTATLNIGANNFTLYGTDGNGNQTPSIQTSVNRHILGDINGDSHVNLTDASLFAVDWDKTSNLTYILSDMNNDGVVDLTDLSILAKWIE